MDCSASRLCGGRRSIPRDSVNCRGTDGLWGPTRSERATHVPGLDAQLVQSPDHPDELALNTDIVIDLIRVRGVGRLEPNLVLLLEEPLERDRVFLDLGDHDVPVTGGGLRPDQHEIAVR